MCAQRDVSFRPGKHGNCARSDLSMVVVGFLFGSCVTYVLTTSSLFSLVEQVVTPSEVHKFQQPSVASTSGCCCALGRPYEGLGTPFATQDLQCQELRSSSLLVHHAVIRHFVSAVIADHPADSIADRFLRLVAYMEHQASDLNTDQFQSEMRLSVDQERIPSQSSSKNCVLMMMAIGAAQSMIKGPVIEFGTYMGFSTRCLAAGVALTSGTELTKLHSFDTFDYLPKKDLDLQCLRWGANATRNRYPDRVERHTLPFQVVTHTGSLSPDFPDSAVWGDRTIAVFVMDSDKSPEAFGIQMKTPLKFASVGTIFILGDSIFGPAVTHQIGISLALERDGFLKFLYNSGNTAHTYWIVMKTQGLDPNYVQNFRFPRFTEVEWNEMWRSFMDRLPNKNERHAAVLEEGLRGAVKKARR